MLKVFRLLFVCMMMCITTPELVAQSLSGTDLTKVNVDDLSDEQLTNYIKQAQSSGYSQTQLEAFARQRGMSESEISKLRNRISQLRLNSGTSTSVDGAVSMQRSDIILSEEDIFGKLAGSSNYLDSEEEEESKIFGYDLFRSNKLNFSPNLNIPTPVDYILGPGDGIVVDLWGATQQYWTFEIGSEGTIRPQDLSPIYVNGLTIEKATEKIIDRLSAIYGGLKPSEGEKTIFYQVSLGNIRNINVTIVGEVNNPGNYALNSLSTVFTALHASGGPTEQGTFRSIRLMRNNKLKTEIDLYDFLVDGVRPNDELLRDGDVIIVKLYNGQVDVTGEVRRPSIYEIKEKESFKQLMDNAGSFNSNAFKSFIEVSRNVNNGKEILNISLEDLDNIYPQDGDLVYVRPNLTTYANRVQVEGAISLDGFYELTDGLTVKQLIEKANGPRGDAYLTRATVYRMNDDFSQQTIPFDLQKLLTGEIADIPLLREDIVRISSVYDLREEYFVEINGEVSLEGTYPYIDNMTVEDIILLAGGLREGASGAKVEISRRNKRGVANTLSEIITLDIDTDLSIIGGDQTVSIEPFDQIFIRRTANYTLQRQMTIEGEISSPGLYAISRKDERISDIIRRADGLTPYAYAEGAVLIRKTEYTEKTTDNELSIEKLNLLKSKVLSDSSLMMNEARQQLFDRLESLIIESEEEENKKQNEQTLRQGLGQSVSDADSLIAVVKLSEEEPTVLDLNEILNNPGSKYDFIIREGDIIIIPGKLETVRVSGEVISALNLGYDEEFSFKDYINDAGGFTSNARKGRSYVQYPNGRRKQARRFLFFKFYPRVEPGSTIIVTKKPEHNKISLQEILAITSSLATITFLVDRIRN